MHRVLYDDLKRIESAKECLTKRVSDFKGQLENEGYTYLLADGIIKIEDLPEIDVPTYQRKLIERDRWQNPVLNDSIRGGRCVKSSLLELNDAVAGPNVRFFPRTKNRTHNEQVSHVEKLVGNLPEIRTGVFAINNFLAGVVTAGALIYAVCFYTSLMSKFQYPPLAVDQIEMAKIFFNQVAAPTFSAIVGPITGFLAMKSRGSVTKSAIERAEYIDERIRVLYLR